MSSWSFSSGTWHAPDAFGDLVFAVVDQTDCSHR
jgi:hypothetical protein